jgi:hypothetical protein
VSDEVTSFGIPPGWHLEGMSIPFHTVGLSYDLQCAHSWAYRTPHGLVIVKALHGRALFCYRIAAKPSPPEHQVILSGVKFPGVPVANKIEITKGGRNSGKSFLRRAMEDPELKAKLNKALREAIRRL